MTGKNKKAQSKPKYKKQKKSAPQEQMEPQNNLQEPKEIEEVDTSEKVELAEEIEVATAPYNFVSLPKKILPSEIKSVDAFKKHIETHGNLSGYIELDITNLTPLFLGGNSEKEKSFSPAGKFIIPGSSLRGMLKNIFKILTCGAFRGGTASQQKGEDFNDEKIYFRCIMKDNQVAWGENYNWSKDLNKVYSKRMQSPLGKRKFEKKAVAGFLIKKHNGEYWIAPLEEGCREKEQQDIRDSIFDNRSNSCVIRRDDKFFTFTGRGNKKKIVRHTEITYVDFNKNNWRRVPDEVIKSYEHDRNRRGVNLLHDDKNKQADEGILTGAQLKELFGEQLKELFDDKGLDLSLLDGIETFIPCHYLEKDGEITAFGHGQYFRIPYQNSIGDIVPANLKSEEIIDFADAVFGRKENWASRVCFEDAVPDSKIKIKIKTLEQAAVQTHPLMQPNPTSYQLYLKQEEGKPLKFWELDKNTLELRGYKLYWHNKDLDWEASKEERELDKGKPEEDRLTKDLMPLQVGGKFKSKIRFENLSAVELGALLMIFDLNGAKKSGYSPAYKIGMGKPFGFGSIEIKPQLFLENNDAYTAEIFDSKGFKIPYTASDAQPYIKVFKDYLAGNFELTAWEKVIDELNKILDWNNTKKPNWSGRVAAMKSTYDLENKTITVDKKFALRLPLPDIFEVVK